MGLSSRERRQETNQLDRRNKRKGNERRKAQRLCKQLADRDADKGCRQVYVLGLAEKRRVWVCTCVRTYLDKWGEGERSKYGHRQILNCSLQIDKSATRQILSLSLSSPQLPETCCAKFFQVTHGARLYKTYQPAW